MVEDAARNGKNGKGWDFGNSEGQSSQLADSVMDPSWKSEIQSRRLKAH